MPVLELHPGASRGLGDEPHLDFAGQVGVGLDLPLRADVPAENDPVRRVVGQDPGPAAFAAVAGAVDDVPTDPRLEHSLHDRCAEQVVLRWFEITEPCGEHVEGPVDRRFDVDQLADHSGIGVGHQLSSVGGVPTSVTASVYPASARFQNVSSWSRNAATATGLSR